MKKYSILKKSLILVAVLISLLITLSLVSNALQNGYDLFQKALAKERGEGNLEEAISLYQRVIKEAKNESLAAKAQLRIGICYEKLGMKEAQKAFQKVIDNYPGQFDAVKVAKEKLAVLLRAQAVVEKGDKGLKIRQVWAGRDVDYMGAPSPDGRYLSFVDWDTGDLSIRDLATGKKRRLTNKGSWFESPEFALNSRWSPDGKMIAYHWFNKDFFLDLRIIGLDGSEPSILYCNEEVYISGPGDWSPDGKHILAGYKKKKDVTVHIVLISVEDGSVRVIKTFDKRYPEGGGFFSPDGRFIVYDLPQKENSLECDIFLLSIDGKREIPLVEHPANDYVLGWATDGKSLLFASDRTGNVDAWTIKVADGEPQGAAVLIKRNIGHIWPMGFTRKGSFYYGLQTGMRDVYIATLDLEKGNLMAPPTKATQRFVGSNFSPYWSPDGNYLVYIREKSSSFGRFGASRVLCILSLETGEVRELSLMDYSYIAVPCWSPEGNSILIRCKDKEGKTYFSMVDPKTGDVTSIIEIKSGEVGDLTKLCGWTPDGKEIVYWRRDMNTKTQSILAYNLETGQEREVYRAFMGHGDISNDTDELAFSADGKWLAFFEYDKVDKGIEHVLKIMPASGGESREVMKLRKGEYFTTIAWTLEGREILFFKAISMKIQEQTCELWRVSVEEGVPKKLGLTMDRVHDLRIHPDGRRIAFSSGHTAAEIWVMGNFLPLTKDKK